MSNQIRHCKAFRALRKVTISSLRAASTACNMDDQDDEPTSPEEQYLVISVCSLAIENEVEKLRQHLSGSRPMSQGELESSLDDIDKFVKENRDVSSRAIRAVVPLDSDSLKRIEVEAKKIICKAKEDSDEGEISSPPASPKKKGTLKGKPGKGKSSKATSTSTPSGQDRPVSQAGPRDDDKGDGNGLGSGVEDHNDTSPTGTGEDNTDASPAGDEVDIKKWPMPKYYIDREDQVYEFEEDAEESQEMVVAGREDLRAGRRPSWRVNYLMVLCPCPLEQRRQFLLKICTRQVPGRASVIITKIGEMVDGTICLYDTNQDITDQISSKDAMQNRRIRRGLPLGMSLKLLSQSLNPPAASSEVYLAGRRAYDEAVENRWINPKEDTTEKSTDGRMRFYLHPNDATKSFIHLAQHVQSAYVACLHVPISELIDLVPKSLQADVIRVYKSLCNVPFEKSDESLTFILNMSKHLDSFPEDGVNCEEEILVAQAFFYVKEAVVDHKTVWTEHVSLYSNGDEDDSVGALDDEEKGAYFNDKDNRRGAMNVVALLSCGKQIGKAAREHDTKYEDIEDLRSVVLRCSIDKLMKTAKSMVAKRFLLKGAAATRSRDGSSNKFDEMYDFSAERIVAFEKDALIAFDLNDNKENAGAKDKLAFDNMSFSHK